MIDFQKVKLIIWDLDETLWKGVLSDGTVQIISENIKLINDLIDAGIVCSICSKNDFETTKKFLKEQKIWNSFVFASINWSSKGERVKQIIDEMQLRQPNVLFIDDNQSNLNEAKQAQASNAYKAEQERLAAVEMDKKLKDIILTMAVKCGKEGKVFGSVTNKEISIELERQGLNIDKKKIETSPIKSIGEYNVKVRLHPTVVSNLKLLIVAE